jgi:hypothetical protein
MAPLPPNNTARYIITYIANGHEHKVTFRYDDLGLGGPPGISFLLDITAILNASRAFMPTDWTLLEGNYIPSGGTFTISTGLPLLVLAGLVTPRASAAPAMLSIPGKGATGRRALYELIGVGKAPDEAGGAYSDYRLTGAESTDVAAIRNALDAAALVDIAGSAPNWKNYANFGYNRHWQNAVRP